MILPYEECDLTLQKFSHLLIDVNPSYHFYQASPCILLESEKCTWKHNRRCNITFAGMRQ